MAAWMIDLRVRLSDGRRALNESFRLRSARRLQDHGQQPNSVNVSFVTEGKAAWLGREVENANACSGIAVNHLIDTIPWTF